MNYLLSILLCIIPSLIILWYIYYNDKKEKEPLYLLFILFIGGILSALLSILITIILKRHIPFLNLSYYKMNLLEIIFKSLIVVALLEETSKCIFNYLATWNNKNFNHIYDPIVYSSFISIGFATLENLLYGFAYYKYGFLPIILRGLISIPSHTLFGIVSGYYIGIAKVYKIKNKKKLSYINKIYSLIIPTILHFIYDLLLIKNVKTNLFMFIFYIISLYILSFKIINKISKIKKML